MCRKLIYLISFVLMLGLAAPANADELIASYEDSEYPDLSISTDAVKDPTLTVTRVLGGTGGAPLATDGDYVLKWVWTDESQGTSPLKIEIRQDWATKTFDVAPYNLITADVWFDEPNAQPATIGIWSMDVIAGWPYGVFWAPALSVPYGLNQWHTVEMDIGEAHAYWDGNDLNCLLAFIFEDLAGDSGVLYTDNMWLRFVRQVQAWRPIPFDNAVSMDPNVDLSWVAGLDANSHDVYFGTSFAEVDNANNSLPVGTSVYKGNQALGNTSYDPGTLERWKTYYWRIDEVNESDPNLWKGDVWSFKTAPVKYVEIPLVSYEDSETHYSVWTGLNISGDFDVSLTLGDKLAGGSTWDPNGALPPVNVPTASDGSNVLGLVWDNEQDLEVEHGCTFEGSDFTYDLSGIDEMVFDIYYPANDSNGGFNPLPHSIFVFDWRFTPSANGSSNLPTTRGEWHTIVIDVSHLNNVGLDNIYDFAFTAHGEDFDPNFADPDNWSALVFMDNLRLRYPASLYATFPSPGDEATGVDPNVDLSWYAGYDANSHDVYFGTSFAEVDNANNSLPVGTSVYKGNQALGNTSYNPGTLERGKTYYWRIDEVNEPNVWKGNIWTFVTVHYLIVDDFESYNPSLADTWKASDKAAVSLSTDPAHESAQAMAIDYNNNIPSPYYSEAYADTTGPDSLELDFGKNWLSEGVKALSLWFQGNPDVRGSFDEDSGIYTIKAAGWDIEDTADGFHYAYKELNSSTWRIIAKVVEIEDTGPWAKAGVMFRDSLDPNSRNAAVVMTPNNGVSFQYRTDPAGDTEDAPLAGVTLPHWVRLTRTGAPRKITADHANDVDGKPDLWTEIGPGDWDMALDTPLIGLCVSSFNTRELCTAVFSDVTMLDAPNGDPIPGSWDDQDIGIPYNDPEPMYVVLEDSSDSNGIVYYTDNDNIDPNVTQIGEWTEWRIDLNDFYDQGVELTDVNRIYIGFGDRDDPCEGGSGEMYFDDIRLYTPEFVPGKLPPWQADFVYDGFIDYSDLGVMVNYWLQTPTDPNIDLYVDGSINFKDFAEMGKLWGEEQVWPTW